MMHMPITFKSNMNCRGFSLVELMVALVITLILLAGIGQIFMGSKKSFTIQDSLGRMQENGRYAMETIVADLRRAGYWGGNVNVTAIDGSLGLAATNDTCPTGDTSWGRMLERRIYGLNEAKTNYACIPNSGATNGYFRGDVLAIHFAAPWIIGGTTTPNYDSDRIYLRTRLFAGKIFYGKDEALATNLLPAPPPLIAAPDPVDGCPAGFQDVLDTDGTLINCSQAIGTFNRASELIAYAYYIGDSGQQCRGSAIPSLFRVSLNDIGRPTNIEEIAYGVDHLQVRYGLDIDDDNSVDRYADAGDGELDSADEWDQVIAVHIWLLVRSECPETGYTNANTYNMGDQNYTPPSGDSFRRQLYTSTVRLRNINFD